ncbi:MAG: tyrosine-type recombinase/integrase [Anaerovoracaceae bacterium]
MLQRGYRTSYIFTTSNGTWYYKRNVIRALKRLYDRIDVPYHKFHSFRHTFGTNLSRAGIPIEETAKLMGHANIGITAKYYIDINADRKREAVEKISAFSL